jgi:hypothetical protein
MYQFTYEKAWGFGFDDPGPALMYGSLAKSNQRLTGPWLHNIWIKTHSLGLKPRQTMRLTIGGNHH